MSDTPTKQWVSKNGEQALRGFSFVSVHAVRDVASDVMIVLHVVAAVVGFGTVGLAGLYAGALAGDPRRSQDPEMRAFFREGPNLPSLAVYGVPVLGFALALTDGRSSELGEGWFLGGSVLWVVGAAAAVSVVGPCERRVQQLVSSADHDSLDELRRIARRMCRAAAVADVSAAAALMVMLFKP